MNSTVKSHRKQADNAPGERHGVLPVITKENIQGQSLGAVNKGIVKKFLVIHLSSGRKCVVRGKSITAVARRLPGGCLAHIIQEYKRSTDAK